jgi:hypothetical protein
MGRIGTVVVGLSGVNGGGLSSTLSLNFEGATRPVGVNALGVLSVGAAAMLLLGPGDGLSACAATTGLVSGGGAAGVVSAGGALVAGVVDAASATVGVGGDSDTVSVVGLSAVAVTVSASAATGIPDGVSVADSVDDKSGSGGVTGSSVSRVIAVVSSIDSVGSGISSLVVCGCVSSVLTERAGAIVSGEAGGDAGSVSPSASVGAFGATGVTDLASSITIVGFGP